MKHKRLLWIAIGAFFLIVSLILYMLKPMTMNDIYNEPNFVGIVVEVDDQAILIEVNENENERASSDLISVSLNVQLHDSMTSFKVGNTVHVFYDGKIAESYPAQINGVYAILLVNE